MKVKPWIEDTCYPGTHWLLYTDSQGNDYVAWVGFLPYYNGRYKWKVFMFNDHKRMWGYEDTLQAAQSIAQAIVEGKTVNLKLI